MKMDRIGIVKEPSQYQADGGLLIDVNSELFIKKLISIIFSVDDGTGVIPCCCWKNKFHRDATAG